MAKEFPGWLQLAEAARRYGWSYELLRRAAFYGQFSRRTFEVAPNQKRPRVYLSIEELNAYQRGGPDELEKVKAKGKKRKAVRS